MSELTNRKPRDTYTWLLHFGSGGPLTETPAAVFLGDGTELPFKVSIAGLHNASGILFATASDLATGLEAKSDLGHGHEISEIVDLTANLAGKLPRLSSISVYDTSPNFSVPLVEETTLTNGHRRWSSVEGGSLEHDGAAFWWLRFFDGTSYTFEASLAVDTESPWDYDGLWNVSIGSGDPSLEIDPQTIEPAAGFTGTRAITNRTDGRPDSILPGSSATTLADANQMVVNVSGVTHRANLSTLWTWIKSKLDSALTLAGSKTFSGQVELTGQTAAANTSAMSRQLVDDRLGRLILDFDFSSTTANGATGGSGVWNYTLPDHAKMLEIICVSGGGGGGSGRCGAAGTNRFGGGGGASGTISIVNVRVSNLPSLALIVTVGQGGTGGAAQMANDSNGIDGSGGGDSRVSSSGSIVAYAGGISNFAAGKGGTNASGTQGQIGGWTGTFVHVPGGSGTSGDGNAPTTPGNMVPSAGGGGGGLNTSNVIGRGGHTNPGGGCWGGGITAARPGAGVDGGTGTDPTITTWIPVGCGGPGGNAGVSVQGGRGRNGVRGGGGGGGGAGTNGFGSGAGGNGGDGFVRIIVHF